MLVSLTECRVIARGGVGFQCRRLGARLAPGSLSGCGAARAGFPVTVVRGPGQEGLEIIYYDANDLGNNRISARRSSGRVREGSILRNATSSILMRRRFDWVHPLYLFQPSPPPLPATAALRAQLSPILSFSHLHSPPQLHAMHRLFR
jgi:hypothetical protein